MGHENCGFKQDRIGCSEVLCTVKMDLFTTKYTVGE
jgi:hypothetical protein